MQVDHRKRGAKLLCKSIDTNNNVVFLNMVADEGSQADLGDDIPYKRSKVSDGQVSLT